MSIEQTIRYYAKQRAEREADWCDPAPAQAQHSPQQKALEENWDSIVSDSQEIERLKRELNVQALKLTHAQRLADALDNLLSVLLLALSNPKDAIDRNSSTARKIVTVKQEAIAALAQWEKS